MKLATFEKDGMARLGVVHSQDRSIFDVAAAGTRDAANVAPLSSMLALIDAGSEGLEKVAELLFKYSDDPTLSVEIEKVRLLAPVPCPRQMRDCMSFPLHILQSRRGQRKRIARTAGDHAELERIEQEPLGDLPDIYRRQPIFYITNRFSVQGHDATVKWPRYSQVMDYELEYGIITKGKAANIKASDARNHVFGYTIFNDFSARDAQKTEMEGGLGPAKGKSFDGGNVMGPWIVTPDEIGDPYKLAMEVRVNGEMRSHGVTDGMLFSFEEIIEHISQDETIMPGEFIGSGTVGNGCGLELGLFLEHGDTVELQVENIGVLRNKVERQDVRAGILRG